jgi:cobalt-zinc-cadmium resistance protein CzcA
VRVTPVYDRTELVTTIDTVKNCWRGLLVVAVLFPSWAAAGREIVALAIPLSMLFAFSGMLRFGIAASLLSLGALDFGMVVDSSVVMVENCVRISRMATYTSGARLKSSATPPSRCAGRPCSASSLS